MSYHPMASTTFKFDESEFIARFIRDYYTETDFDLKSSFDEYFMNFVQSNSAEYNSHVFIDLYIAEKINGRKRRKLNFDNFLYEKLYCIIIEAMKIA